MANLYGAQNFRFDPTTEGAYVYVANSSSGTAPNGENVSANSSSDGDMYVDIHGPAHPFGSLHTESATMVFQTDAVYGLSSNQINQEVGHLTGGVSSATNTGTNNKMTCSTGTTALSFSTIQSRKRLRYRPGQGVTARFTAVFEGPVANMILVAGVGTSESGFFFGYNGTSFGILYSNGGVRTIRTLTVTTASTSTQPYNVVLNSATSVNVTATNNGSTVKTAYEIAQGTYPGWTAKAIGSTVVFLAGSTGTKTGTYSLGQSGAGVPTVAAFAITTAGVASTDTWIPQTSWNGDKLLGDGLSGMTLNPLYGNVYQIGIQYLGYGAIVFKVEATSTLRPGSEWVTVHTIRYPNTSTAISINQPTFPYTQSAYSAGSTTNGSVSSGSFCGFLEGKKELNGPRFSYSGTSTSVSTGSYYCLLTILNMTTYKGRANQTVVNLIDWLACHDDATPVIMYLIKNATLVGTPNFALYSTSGSCTAVDTAATTCTITDNEQIVYQLPVGQGGSALVQFVDEITIQPGETLTLAAKTVTGTATYTVQTLNTREDQ